MKRSLEDLARAIGAEIVCPAPVGVALSGGFTCDLLSEVIAHAPTGSILITVLAHVNVVAVCVAADLPAVLVCGGRVIPADTQAAAAREGIALLSTRLHAYETSAALHRALEGSVP